MIVLLQVLKIMMIVLRGVGGGGQSGRASGRVTAARAIHSNWLSSEEVAVIALHNNRMIASS